MPRRIFTPRNPGRTAFHNSAVRREHYLNADSVTFDKVVSKEASKDRVVLVDFYADWCQPCKVLSPILEKLTATEAMRTGHSGRVLDLVTVDADTNVELAGKYAISALPTVIAFKDGEPIRMFKGALPEAAVREFISQL